MSNKTEYSVDITVAQRRAAKAWECDLCKDQIIIGSLYTEVMSRQAGERFPQKVVVCKKHPMEAVPFGVLFKRKVRS